MSADMLDAPPAHEHDDDDHDTQQHACQGRIDRLEVENFKSYKGHQRIGPFKNFTAVIGPNGSGKSNLMDAISFVLGVRTQHLRGSLKELLYSASSIAAAEGAREAAGEARPRRGHVKLVYETEGGAEVHFTRAIAPSGGGADATYASVYKIDDRAVTWDAYAARLAGFGILVKVRNFLVFQVRACCAVAGVCFVASRRARCSIVCAARTPLRGGGSDDDAPTTTTTYPIQKKTATGRHREGRVALARGPGAAV